ncbi:MAG: hypothetical protein AB1640_25595 [bacterium]
MPRKDFIAVGCVIIAGVLLAAGASLAANGYGAGDGSGPLHDVLGGQPFTYAGLVASTGSAGGGLVIATDAGNVTVYGIGPRSYWDDLGVERPAVGDWIEVSGFTVDFGDIERNIAMSVTLSNVLVPLRDPDTGLPLW